jgi:hypothetical protein
MFMRYVGGGIGHGGNPTNIETPAVPDAEDEGSDEGLDEDPNEGHGTEGDDDIVSDNEDEDFFDTGRVEDGEVCFEDDSDDDNPNTEL